MAKYGVVAGEKATQFIIEMLKDFRDIEITYTPYTMDKVIEDLTNTGGLSISDLKAILIIDYAFIGGNDTIAEQFVAIQDLMHTNMLSDVTLYLITKNTDLHEKLKGTVAGLPGTYFESVQIFLIEGQYTPFFMKSVMQGERDNQGLYNQEALHRKTREQRLRESRDEEIESRRNLSEEIIRYDKSEPTTVLSKTDYQDSPQRKALDAEKKREEEEQQKKANRENTNKPVEVPKEEIKINVHKKVQTAPPVVVDQPTGLDEEKGLSNTELQIKEQFDKFQRVRTNVAKGKIESDEGVISIISAPNAGGSGVVANMAEMYGMAGRKVLIIDLDIENRMQTVYFNQYDDVVRDKQGAAMSLIEVVRGFGIEESVVPINKQIDILSVSRDEDVPVSWVASVGGSIETMLIEAKGMYDIVLLDIPFRLFPNYMSSLREVNRNIFIVENTFYKLEDLIKHSVHPLLLNNAEDMEDLLKKSTITLNKYKREMMDMDGQEINRYYVRNILDDIGYPYDRVGVTDEIPYYSEWEKQYFTGVRYLWEDVTALGVYRRVFGKVVV